MLKKNAIEQPDPFEKTIQLPVGVTNGKLELFYGGKIPQLKEGVIGELTVPAYALVDEAWRWILQEEHTDQVLPPGTDLQFGVRYGKVPEELRSLLYFSPSIIPIGSRTEDFSTLFGLEPDLWRTYAQDRDMALVH